MEIIAKKRRITKHPETVLCKQFCKIFGYAINLNNVIDRDVIWYHVPNGQRSGNKTVRVSQIVYAGIDKSMGALSGVPDYVFIWSPPIPERQAFAPHKIVYLEFKAKTGSQSQSQKDFEERCKKQRIPYYVVRSVGQAIDILKENGLIKNTFKIM